MEEAWGTGAAAASEPDFEREIHYALRAEAMEWHTRRRKAKTLCWPIYSSLRMFAIPGGILLFYGVMQLLPGPLWLRAWVYVIVMAVVFVPLLVRGRREKLESERLMGQLPGLSNQRHRVRVTGPAARVVRLRSLVEGEVDEFEPRIIRVGRARRPGLRDVAAFTCLLVTLLLVFAFTKRLMRIDFPMSGMVLIYLAVGLAFVIWAFLWPTYLRFVPGRMDVLSYGILGRGRPSVRSIDLRTARALVMIPGSAVLFLPGEDASTLLDVGWVPDSDPFVFERAILAAAKSEAEAPGLPEGELGG